MTRHNEGTIGEPAQPKAKKKVSPARNDVAAVLLRTVVKRLSFGTGRP
jgi:hypothetical protein